MTVLLAMLAFAAPPPERPVLVACPSAACRWERHRAHSRRHRRLRYIAPYRGWLHSTGQCESGYWSLRKGLTAVSPGGTYRGKYQFDMGSWARAGGTGDPAAASWLEQGVRAVRWRQMVGAGAWPVCG